jgi:tocopherol O-methyltransferase
MSELYQQIQQFYDRSSKLWEDTWGEHMHHGYYGKAGTYKAPRRQAQIQLIEELLYWAKVSRCDRLLDVGCGIGGSTLYLADKFNSNACGITLSPVQASRATTRVTEGHYQQNIEFKVADAQEMPFADNSFDLVWSLESGEHMPNKTKFLQECYRVLKDNGTLILATWCHRPTNSLAGELTRDEKKHLEKIYHTYCLPYVISLPEYEQIADHLRFQDIRSDDWSVAVEPFWDEVIDSAIDLNTIIGLFQSGRKTIEAVLSLGLMSRGYRRGLIRFGVLTGRK